jgi:hypothetical protein
LFFVILIKFLYNCIMRLSKKRNIKRSKKRIRKSRAFKKSRNLNRSLKRSRYNSRKTQKLRKHNRYQFGGASVPDTGGAAAGNDTSAGNAAPPQRDPRGLFRRIKEALITSVVAVGVGAYSITGNLRHDRDTNPGRISRIVFAPYRYPRNALRRRRDRRQRKASQLLRIMDFQARQKLEDAVISQEGCLQIASILQATFCDDIKKVTNDEDLPKAFLVDLDDQGEAEVETNAFLFNESTATTDCDIAINRGFFRVTPNPRLYGGLEVLIKGKTQQSVRLGAGQFGDVFLGIGKKEGDPTILNPDSFFPIAYKSATIGLQNTEANAEIEALKKIKAAMESHRAHVGSQYIAHVLDVKHQVFKLYSYGSLDKFLKCDTGHQNYLTLYQVNTFFENIINGLQFLHSSSSLVHCDMAARNILLERVHFPEDFNAHPSALFFNARITDFGKTRQYSHDSDSINIRDSEALPVRWLSPRFVKNGSTILDPYNDYWGAICILSEMLTRRTLPYKGVWGTNALVWEGLSQGKVDVSLPILFNLVPNYIHTADGNEIYIPNDPATPNPISHHSKLRDIDAFNRLFSVLTISFSNDDLNIHSKADSVVQNILTEVKTFLSTISGGLDKCVFPVPIHPSHKEGEIFIVVANNELVIIKHDGQWVDYEDHMKELTVELEWDDIVDPDQTSLRSISSANIIYTRPFGTGEDRQSRPSVISSFSFSTDSEYEYLAKYEKQKKAISTAILSQRAMNSTSTNLGTIDEVYEGFDYMPVAAADTSRDLKLYQVHTGDAPPDAEATPYVSAEQQKTEAVLYAIQESLSVTDEAGAAVSLASQSVEVLGVTTASSTDSHPEPEPEPEPEPPTIRTQIEEITKKLKDPTTSDLLLQTESKKLYELLQRSRKNGFVPIFSIDQPEIGTGTDQTNIPPVIYGDDVIIETLGDDGHTVPSTEPTHISTGANEEEFHYDPRTIPEGMLSHEAPPPPPRGRISRPGDFTYEQPQFYEVPVPVSCSSIAIETEDIDRDRRDVVGSEFKLNSNSIIVHNVIVNDNVRETQISFNYHDTNAAVGEGTPAEGTAEPKPAVKGTAEAKRFPTIQRTKTLRRRRFVDLSGGSRKSKKLRRNLNKNNRKNKKTQKGGLVPNLRRGTNLYKHPTIPRNQTSAENKRKAYFTGPIAKKIIEQIGCTDKCLANYSDITTSDKRYYLNKAEAELEARTDIPTGTVAAGQALFSRQYTQNPVKSTVAGNPFGLEKTPGQLSPEQIGPFSSTDPVQNHFFK